MSNKLNILIVDDESSIREILVDIITSVFPSNFHQADCGNNAIIILDQQEIDLVICDFNMPNGNGGCVFKKVLSLNSKPKFILSTSDIAEKHKEIVSHADSRYLEKPFEFEILIKLISELLDIEPISSEIHKFVNLPIISLSNFDLLPFDVYLKLGVDHQVKYFNSNRKFTETDKQRLSKLNAPEVFVKVDDFYKYISIKQRTAFQTYTFPPEGADHPFEISSVKDELTNLGLTKIIKDKEIMDLTQKNLKTVFALSYKVRQFSGLLDWVQNNEHSPKKMQSILLTLFCSIILKNIKSISYDFKTYLNLSYAAVLHDINLDDFIVKNEFRILNGIRINSHINRAEQEIMLNHVPTLIPIISSWAHCPTEVIQIVEQHHERANGTGFPMKLTGGEIQILSAIFNVAHDVASLVMERKSGDELNNSISKLSEEYKGHKHFEEPMAIITREILVI
jgi:response regulator RpfG family c-di-GMP phosphodiesterase